MEDFERFGKIAYQLTTVSPETNSIRQSKVPPNNIFIGIQNSGLTLIIGLRSHGSQVMRNLTESCAAIQ